MGRENHELNDAGGVDAAKARYLPYNLLKSWRKIRQLGPFDISIIDPPTNQRGSFVAENDYAQILKRLPTFMRRGGRVVMCLNSPYLPYRFLQEQMVRRCPECRFEERLFPSGDFEEVDPDHALKVAVFRYG